MEMFIVLLLLALSEKNPELKETLKGVLSFYRENRDLLFALSGDGRGEESHGKETRAEGSSPPAPPEGPLSGEGIKLIEEFLKRQKL